MPASLVVDEQHPNVIAPGKRPRTTLTPTVVLRDGWPFVALSSPGEDAQDQQALQMFLSMAVFGMTAQEAIGAPRFASQHYRESFREHRQGVNALLLEDRIAPGLAGLDARHGTVFGAANVRRQRFVTGW